METKPQLSRYARAARAAAATPSPSPEGFIPTDNPSPATKAKLLLHRVKTSEAYAGVSEAFPELPESIKATLSRTAASIFRRAADDGVSYTPFQTTPEGAISYPQFVVDTLRKHGACMPEKSVEDPLYIGGGQSSLTALSGLSRVAKGSLSAVNAGRQHLTPSGLERWRVALAKIGDANQDNETLSGLSSFASPIEFLETLLEQWRDLDSPLPLSRIKEWVLTLDEKHGITLDTVDALVERYRPTYKGYMRSIAKVWREEYETGTLPKLFEHSTFLDVLNTRTVSRRMSRGFHEMIKAVHTDMTEYNQRVKYPKSNFQVYKTRYGAQGAETGLSAEVLVAYCLFLGINPISILQWVAYRETVTPGTWSVSDARSVEGLIIWNGAISPRECLRFYDAIHQMGLVSDQNRWAIQLLHPSFIYKNLPTEDEVYGSLSSPIAVHDLLRAFMADSPQYSVQVKTKGELAEGCYTPFAQAIKGHNVLEAHKDFLCLCLVSDGEVDALGINPSKQAALAEERNAMGDAIFKVYMLDKLVDSNRNVPEKYILLTCDGEVVPPELFDKVKSKELEIDAAKSYRGSASGRLRAGNHFYSQLLVEQNR